MNGVHDMGGMHGLGPIDPEPEAAEPVFHHRWESRVHALTLASPTRSNIDAGRHQRELIPGPDYLRMSYYEKWFTSLSALLVKAGLATPDELASGQAAPGGARSTPVLKADAVTTTLTRPMSYVREIPVAPRFAVGDRVRCRDLNPPGHIRLPRYVRGHVGDIAAVYGAHVFPDSNAAGLGEDPQPLYSVRFNAVDLWGETANPRDSVRLDLWEPYLERA